MRVKSFKKLVVSIVLFLLVSTSLFIVPYIVNDSLEKNSINNTGASWYNSDWLYKKVVNITNPVTNYPMKITIGYSSGGDVNLGGKCRTDFSDVRFINSTEKGLLNYW